MKTVPSLLRCLKSALFGVFVSLLFGVKSHAVTYYVDAVGGNDLNAGTSTGEAWQTLSHVSSQTFSPGDQILFKAGNTFVGQLYPKGSGSSGSPIIIDKYGMGAAPVISGNTTTVTDGAAVLLKNQQYWEIRNLEITNASGRTGVKIYSNLTGTTNYFRLSNLNIHNVNGTQPSLTDRLYGGIIIHHEYAGTGAKFDDVVIAGCEVHDINVIGIQLAAYSTASRSTNTRIVDTTVHDCGQDGIIWRQVSGAVIEYCTVYSTGLTQLTATVGIWLKLADNSIIQYCESYNNTDNGTDGQGFDLDIGCNGCIIQYCYSHDNDGGFVLLCTDNGDNVGSTVRYNISQDDGMRTFRIGGGVSGAQIYNNTIYASATVPLAYVVSMANWNGYPSNTVFNNNIIYQLTDAAYSLFGATGTVFDANCFYGNHPATEPLDANKVFGDPRFVAPGTGSIGQNTVSGYQLSLDSPCRNTGLTISGSSSGDYFGGTVPMGGATDRGAAEYASSNTAKPLDYTTLILMAEPFDASTTGTLPVGWTESAVGRTTAVNDPNGTDKSMEVRNLSTDTATITATKPFSGVASGILTVDYSIKPGQTNVSSALEVLSASGSPLVSCAFSDLGKIDYKSNNTWMSTGVPYTANTWNDVRIVLDVANRIFSIYINNMATPLVYQVPFAAPAAADAGTIRFSVNHGAATATATLNELYVFHQINPSSTLLAEPFDSATAGTLPAGWTSAPSGKATAFNDPTAMDMSLILENLSTDTGSSTAVKTFPSMTSGLVTVDCKINSGQTNVASQIDILGTGNSQAATCSFSAAGTITYKASGSWANTGLSYSANTWYNLRFILDLASRTYSLYVNNLAAPVAFNVPFASSVSNVSSYRLLLNHGAATSFVTLDDAYVFHRVNPSLALLAEPFDSTTTGSLPSGWTSSPAGRTTAVEDPSSTDKSLQLQNLVADTGSNYAVKSFTNTTTGFVTADAKVKSAQSNVASQIEILGAGSLQAAVCSLSASGTITYKTNGSWVNSGVGYAANTWYNLRFVIDVTGQTYSLYVNDFTVPIASGVPFASPGTTNVDSFRLLLNHDTSAATVKVNDVYISR